MKNEYPLVIWSYDFRVYFFIFTCGDMIIWPTFQSKCCPLSSSSPVENQHFLIVQASIFMEWAATEEGNSSAASSHCEHWVCCLFLMWVDITPSNKYLIWWIYLLRYVSLKFEPYFPINCTDGTLSLQEGELLTLSLKPAYTEIRTDAFDIPLSQVGGGGSLLDKGSFIKWSYWVGACWWNQIGVRNVATALPLTLNSAFVPPHISSILHLIPSYLSRITSLLLFLFAPLPPCFLSFAQLSFDFCSEDRSRSLVIHDCTPVATDEEHNDCQQENCDERRQLSGGGGNGREGERSFNLWDSAVSNPYLWLNISVRYNQVFFSVSSYDSSWGSLRFEKSEFLDKSSITRYILLVFFEL